LISSDLSLVQDFVGNYPSPVTISGSGFETVLPVIGARSESIPPIAISDLSIMDEDNGAFDAVLESGFLPRQVSILKSGLNDLQNSVSSSGLRSVRLKIKMPNGRSIIRNFISSSSVLDLLKDVVSGVRNSLL
jgi:hypothetical protein